MTIAFLSYSMRDSVLQPMALEEIADELRGVHELVYVDLLHNRDARPQAHLEHVLRSSTTLYALQTPAYWSSPWARRELSLARRLGLVVTPVRWTLVDRKWCQIAAGKRAAQSTSPCRVADQALRTAR